MPANEERMPAVEKELVRPQLKTGGGAIAPGIESGTAMNGPSWFSHAAKGVKIACLAPPVALR